MFERFTADARATVIGAQAHARRLGHRPIGTEHLVLAVLDGPSHAATALRACGIDTAALDTELATLRASHRDADRRALASLGIDLDAVVASVGGELPELPPHPCRRFFGRRRRATPSARGHVPFGRRAKKALELSLREALRLGDRAITADHILLGVLREGEGLACRVLVARGASLTALRRQVEDALRQSA